MELKSKLLATVSGLPRIMSLSAVGAAAIAISSDLSGASVHAQALEIEEVIVTARRVQENAQEVPITVTAFSGNALKERGLTNITQIGDFTPGLTIDFTSPISGSTASASTFIRGVGQSDFLLTIDPGVGIYVDGVYIARSVGGVVDLLNIESVEVLKGPQGTLFGRNTIGGAINITSREPGDEFFAEGEVTIGRFDRRDIRATIETPITDTLAVSFAFSSKNRDGYAERIPFTGEQEGDLLLTGPTSVIQDGINAGFPFLSQAGSNSSELGNENTDSGRAIAVWKPTERFKAKLSAEYTSTREAGTASTLLSNSSTGVDVVTGPDGVASVGAVVPTPFGPNSLASLFNTALFDPTIIGLDIFPGNIPIEGVNVDADPNNNVTPFDARFITGDPDTTFATGPNFSDLDLFGISLTLNYDLTENIEIKSITAYRDLDAAFGRDGDNSPLVIDQTSNLYSQEQFTQELQLNGLSFNDKLQWTVGGFFFYEEGTDNVFVSLGGAPLLQLDELNQIENDSFALFGQATYSLTEDLSITGGIRYTDETKRFDPVHLDLLGFFGVTQLLPLGEVSEDFSDVSYRAGIEYRVNDDLFLFTSVSTAFKSGGFVGRTVDPQPAVTPFDEEDLIQYEAGFKSDLFGGKLRLNASAFYSDYTDIQIVVQSGITPITVNAAEAEIYGLEVELQANPFENFFILGNAAFTEAQFTEIDQAVLDAIGVTANPISTENEFANTPEFKGSVALEYVIPLESGEILLRGDYTYTSTVYNNVENSPELVQDPTNLINAGITYKHGSGKWDLGLSGRNLTNERFIVSGFDQPGVGFTEATFNRPVEWALTLRYRFD